MKADLEKFLRKMRINKGYFIKSGLDWEDLKKIKQDYIISKRDLEPLVRYIVKQLHNLNKVHSIRYRLKDPDHLIAKIIRKKVDFPERKFTLENYKKQITDLIGVRILHLFKKDWHVIHNFIGSSWNFYKDKKPIAYYREGDFVKMIDEFKKCGCIVKEHRYGYRSIHYLIESRPGKEVQVAELQVRTIFEEAWSEIDHTVRYPRKVSNPLLEQYLVMFNGLVGSADEMGSYVSHLSEELLKMKERNRKRQLEKTAHY
jgi:putative GTP pyrophosphokinase